jgi:hypothetical protein
MSFAVFRSRCAVVNSVEATQQAKASDENMVLPTTTRLETSTKECNTSKPCHRLPYLNSACSITANRRQSTNGEILPEDKHGWRKARKKVASSQGSKIGSRKCRLRIVFHSQPFPQTRGDQRVQKLFVGASFCPGTWRFPLVLPLAERHTAQLTPQPSSAVHLNLVTCGNI